MTFLSTIGDRLSRAFPVEPPGTDGVPGRWAAGTAMVLAPVLTTIGALLRIRFHFFYPEQLSAFRLHPALVTTSYSLFAAGNVLLWPAVLSLAARIGVRSPGWAVWGGTLAVLGLFARTFHAGVDHEAFQLARARGAETATAVVSDGYGAFHVFAALNLAIMAGWVVLALGAWRTGVLGVVPAVGLAATAALPLGVLKGTTMLSLVALAGLCLALVPLGFKLLREQPRPRRAVVLRWVPLVGVVVVVAALTGQAG